MFFNCVLMGIFLDHSGQLLPLKILGSISDMFFIMNQYIFFTFIMCILTLLWFIFTVDEKKQDILSILDGRHNKIYGKDISQEIQDKLKKYNILVDVNIDYYGYLTNRYIIENINCKISRIKYCLGVIYPYHRFIIEDNKIYVEIKIEYSNHINLNDYIELLQINSLIALNNSNNITIIDNKVNLFIETKFFQSVLLILLLSTHKKSQIFLVNYHDIKYNGLCEMFTMKHFLNKFDHICNKNNFKPRKAIDTFVFIFIDHYEKEVEYILKQAIENGIIILLVGSNNIYNLRQNIIEENTVTVYNHGFFNKTVLIPQVSPNQIENILFFLKHNNNSLL